MMKMLDDMFSHCDLDDIIPSDWRTDERTDG